MLNIFSVSWLVTIKPNPYLRDERYTQLPYAAHYSCVWVGTLRRPRIPFFEFSSPFSSNTVKHMYVVICMWLYIYIKALLWSSQSPSRCCWWMHWSGLQSCSLRMLKGMLTSLGECGRQVSENQHIPMCLTKRIQQITSFSIWRCLLYYASLAAMYQGNPLTAWSSQKKLLTPPLLPSSPPPIIPQGTFRLG